MAKKKKRYDKNCGKKRLGASRGYGEDTHHLCYQKREWRSGALVALRDYWYCKVSIPKDTLHRSIHRMVPVVPPPKIASAKSALEQLHTLERYGVIHEDDPIERRLEVLVALFDYIEQPTAAAFRAQLDIAHRFYHKPP